MAIENLTNKVFGKLTTKYIAPSVIIKSKPQVSWYCECECGNICLASAKDLLNGNVMSCGCNQDLSGKRFGKLIVRPYYETNIDNKPQNDERYWLCKCDCGELKFVRASDLINGTSISCGCYEQKIDSETISKNNKAKKKRKYIKKNKLAIQNKYDLDSKEYGIGYCANSNKTFYFDKEDFDKIKYYKWNSTNNKYDQIYTIINGKTTHIAWLLVETPAGKCVRHINGDNSDNRKSNIEIVTRAQLNHINSKSGVAGVWFLNTSKKWIATIKHNNVMHQKSFNTKDEAIAQRKAWENELHN